MSSGSIWRYSGLVTNTSPVVISKAFAKHADSPKGCKFCGRCPLVEARCVEEEPPLRQVAGGDFVRCHLVGDDGAPATGEYLLC